MLRKGAVAALAALMMIGAAGCGGPDAHGAAASASRLLAAAVAQDHKAFEAEIDRPAVREDLRRQMIELARANGVEVEGGPSDFALVRMIGPDAVRLVMGGSREPAAAAPPPEKLEPLMTMVGRERACLHAPADEDRCLLTFAKEKRHWRLVGMLAMDLEIPVESGD